MCPPLLPDPDPVVSGFPIMATPTVSREAVIGALPADVHSRFIEEMVPELWAAGLEYGVDPVGMIAQSAKETGWGNYAGKVLPQFFNTAGIKIRYPSLFPGITDGDRPLAHQMFPNWKVGAMAHAQHLRAYAGRPVIGLVVDPRYTLVSPPFVTMWAELGGRWDGGGPTSTYGQEVEEIMGRLTA